MPKFVTTEDYIYSSPARRVTLFVPKGTEVVHVGTNAGVKTTEPYGVARPSELPGCDPFDAVHYWYWIPENIVTNAPN